MQKTSKHIFWGLMVMGLFLIADGQAFAAPLTVNENPSPVFSTLIPDQAYVIKDNVNYKLYYAGNDFASIKLATSTDGINWSPDASNPVVLSDPLQAEHADVHFYSAGFAGANSGINPSAATMYYRMWYQGTAAGIGGWRYTESPDGINWYNQMAVTQTGTSVTGGMSANYGIADVVYTPGGEGGDVNKTFRIYVNAQYAVAPYSSNELAVMAYSANGYNWTGYDPTSVGYATPVFGGTLDGVSFDTDHIGWFKVIKNSDTDWEAFYSGGKGSTYVALNGIGYATSIDGINWVRRQTLFTTNDPVAWRNQSVWMPSVVKSGNNYKIFFLGSNDESDGSWIWWNLGEADLTVTPIPATFHVINLVINGNGGTASSSNFSVHVENSGVDVSGSPMVGTTTPGTSYSLPAGTYAVSENADSSYTQSFSGDCDSSGNITLAAGDDKICTIISTNIPALMPVIPPSYGGGSTYSPSAPAVPPIGHIMPLIGLTKVPSPLALSAKSGSVTYDYTVWNVGGQQALTDVTVTDDKCGPITFLSGDLNNNSKLDPGENWKYTCTATLSNTTTNTAVAIGHSDDIYHQAAIATAIATVVVGSPLAPPLINIVRVPSRLTPFPAGGGDITYTYTVTNPGVAPMHDVIITDTNDECGSISGPSNDTSGSISGPSGDTNGDKLLNPGETWTYICQTNITASTMDIATAKGSANGFTALGYAFNTVLVSGFSSAFNEQVEAIAINLHEGDRGSNVKTLQQFLISQNTGPANRALAKVGATSYFGALTRAALAELQAKAGIKPALGNFGPITRAYLSHKY